MEIIEIKEKKQYQEGVTIKDHASFLQSWEWGEMQDTNNQVRRFGILENNKIISTLTLIKKHLFYDCNYYYCPRGQAVSKIFLELIGNRYQVLFPREKIVFLRFEPINEFRIPHSKFKISKTIDVQPSKTVMLDLSKTEDELLAKMHPKTRYNIRLAEKKGIKIIEAEKNNDNFESFWQLMNQTKNRDGFRLHEKKYYQEMLQIDFIKLYLATYEEKTIAANIISFFGDTVTYLHGASANEYRNVMAPYLLQWHVIKSAQEKGYQKYDFYGVDDLKWPGVTRFKQGFGGEIIEYPGTFDLIFHKIYYLIYQIARRIRRNI